MKLINVNHQDISDLQIEQPIQKIAFDLTSQGQGSVLEPQSVFVELTLVDPQNGNKYLIPRMTFQASVR